MKTIPVSLFVAGLLAPAVAMAQADPHADADRGRDGWKERHRQFAESWKAADKDGDGFLTPDEFAAMPRIGKLPEEKRPKVFARLDENGDGKLARNELKRPGRDHEGHRPPLPRLAELDTDQSGGVSLEELKKGPTFQKFPPERQSQIFQRLDTDKDGQITPKDRPRPPHAGPHGQPDPKRMIQHLDKDGDGALSFEEFRAGRAVSQLSEDAQEDRFEALDKNADLKLTPDELPRPRPAADADPQ